MLLWILFFVCCGGIVLTLIPGHYEACSLILTGKSLKTWSALRKAMWAERWMLVSRLMGNPTNIEPV